MNTTFIKKETPVIKMTFVERENIRIDNEIEKLESLLKDFDLMSEDDLKKSENKKSIKELKDKITNLKTEKENLKPYLASIDSGKYNTKRAYVLEGADVFTTDIFESRVQRHIECTHDCGEKFFVGTQMYSISNSAKRVSDRNVVTKHGIEPMNNTKAHEYHRILMLRALYEIYLQTGRKVFNVGVGTSIDNYKEDEGARVYLTMLDESLPIEEVEKIENAQSTREKNDIYKAYAQKIKDQFITKEFTVKQTNHEAVTLVINDLYVAPETITGATMVDTDDLSHAYIMDLGGLNDSYLPIVNHGPEFDYVITNKKGMAHKYEDIANWIVTKSSETTSMNCNDVEAFLNDRDKMIKEYPEIEELIRDYMTSYFDEVTDRLKRNKVALKEGISSLVFIGGGSQVLAPYIEDYYTNVCDMKQKVYIAKENGIYSNVTGIYNAAAGYFENREYLRSMSNQEVC